MLKNVPLFITFGQCVKIFGLPFPIKKQGSYGLKYIDLFKWCKLSLAESGLDLDLRYIENVLIDYDR